MSIAKHHSIFIHLRRCRVNNAQNEIKVTATFAQNEKKKVIATLATIDENYSYALINENAILKTRTLNLD